MRKVEKMTFTAMMIALAFTIAEMMKLIPILQHPQGGSVSLALLPIFILAFYLGPVYGTIGGIGYGIINFFFDGYGYNPWSIVFDYVLAFGLVGLIAGFCSKWAMRGYKWYNFVSVIGGMTVACSVRFLMHTIAGTLAWNTPFGVSALYNAGYVYGSLGFCSAIILLAYKPLTDYAVSKFVEKDITIEEIKK